MEVAPAITDMEQLKDAPEINALTAANQQGVTDAKYDRDELSIYIDRGFVREAVTLLRDSSELRYTYLADITCVDWYPREPRFEVIIHMLSMTNKSRVRLKVRPPLSGRRSTEGRPKEESGLRPDLAHTWRLPCAGGWSR